MKTYNQKFKKIILILLSAILVFTNPLTSKALFGDVEKIEPYYTDTAKKTSSLTISGVTAKCYATIQVKESMPLKIIMELQKEKSSGFETVKTWTSSKTGYSLSMSESRGINVFSTYRLKVTFYIGSNDIEIVYKYKS